MLTITNFAGNVAEKRKPHVLTTRESFENVEDRVYKVEYGRGEAFETGEVLRRARQMARESPYNMFFNNCEHFARYCKVGEPKSVQVKNFKRTAGGVSANLIKDLVKTRLVDKTNKVLPTKVKVGGVVGAGIIEAVLTSDDIYRYYQMLEKGTIDEDEFVELVLKRLLIAITSVVGSEVGAAAGFLVAGPVGMVIGGLVGNILGKLTGRVMGKAVVFGKDAVLALLAQYYSQSYRRD